MKIKKILKDFGTIRLVENRLFSGSQGATYEYDFQKDVMVYKTKILPNTALVTYHKDFAILQNSWNLMDAKSDNNSITLKKFLEDKPYDTYEYNIILTSLLIDDRYFLSYFDQDNWRFYFPFDPFLKKEKWKLKFNKNYIKRLYGLGKSMFAFFVSPSKLLCYSSQTAEKLWDYDLSKYFNREIPTYASGDLIYKISVEKIIYNPAFQSLILSITPNIKIALQAETGELLWEAEGYPRNTYYLLDEQTGHIHYFIREIVKGMERDRIHYHIINGETGEFLLSRDFTEDLQVPEDKVFDINPKPTLGAFKDNFLYFTMADLGRLYKMDKYKSEVIAIDEQEGIYYKSNPVIHQNRLFLTEDNDIQNLWVFEI